MRRMLIVVGLAVAGCSTGHVRATQETVGVVLPAPRHVVVTDFAITLDEVRLDSGASARLLRLQGGQPVLAEQEQAARATQAALAETLVARLASYGLPVERMEASATPLPDSLLVQGQILSVDEGNRTRRTLIGLGSGKSSVAADAQLYYVTDSGNPQFLQAFTGTADSGRMPGAAETLGAGAAADRVATSAAMTAATHTGAETRRTGDEANADKLSNALARQIGTYAAGQAWIPCCGSSLEGLQTPKNTRQGRNSGAIQ